MTTIAKLQAFAVPGQGSIIDTIDPTTDRSRLYQETDEQIAARYPGAVRVDLDTWIAEAAQRQKTDIQWRLTDAHEYHEKLNILPPAFWSGGMFLVGEPIDHSYETGKPRFIAYWERHGRFLVCTRPITIAEARQLVPGVPIMEGYTS